MVKSLQCRVESVANSVWLTALGRIGVPLILAAVTWGASTVLALERRMVAAENKDTEITRRVDTLETHRERDRGVAADIRADIAGLRASNEAIVSALRRIEGYIDRRNGQ